MKQSLPTWERGLKRIRAENSHHEKEVAPHVGAWIETLIRSIEGTSLSVAPHVGAWIETWHSRQLRHGTQVAPHVGAWIETLIVLHFA